MRLKIKYDKGLGYIHVVTSGNFNETTAVEWQKTMAMQVAHYQCQKILHDMRPAKIDIDTYSIYELPKSARGMGLQNTRRAIIYSGEPQDFLFFETVASNQGQIVRVFTEMNEAIVWLLA